MKMKLKHMIFRAITTMAVLFATAVLPLRADPLVTSWFTNNTGKYARIYTSTGNRSLGISSTTWTGQTSPTYAGVHEIDYSSSWVYIRNTGLASYVMGPWNNPNLPKNQGTATTVYRFPRNVAGATNTPATKTVTSMGAIGFLVDGVAVYNTSDGFSYSVSNAKDATPIGGIGSGDGIWNRDAGTNELGSFDYALNHPQPSGQYHAHINPLGVRYVLGDNVNYDSSTKIYSENTNTTIFKHSPIIGWMNDGLPLYGPYGYSDPTNSASGVRRMISGYVLRDGSYGTANLNNSSVGRTKLPTWALANPATNIQAGQAGPLTTYSTGSGNSLISYTLGHYAEDYEYLGDLGFMQGVTSTVSNDTAFYDLNKYNARYCVTPEYPNGTWAYFSTIKADGSGAFPYNVARYFMNTPSGGSTSISNMNAETPLTLYFKGGTNIHETLGSPSVNNANGNVTLTWSALEGGSYQVLVSSNLATWTTNSSLTTTATNNSVSEVETGAASASSKRFYRTRRTAVATYDSTGY